jgi:alginate O-acetyltransferase complex protein AlgI
LRFDDPVFLFLYLPGFLGLYFLVLGVGALSPRLTAWAWTAVTWLLLGASVLFIAAAWTRTGFPGAVQTVMPFGLGLMACHAIAFAVDAARGDAPTRRPLTAALYLVQFPVLPAGPVVRYADFATQLARRTVNLGTFTYGVRRFVIGLVKVAFIAAVLSGTADRVFAMPAAKLSADAAWLGAVCFSLQLYFQFSGYSDMAIGLGRMLGFRYPENFRRPYTADSVREFWRRWNITLLTWLRDYLYLPIAGRDNPTPLLYVNIVIGFCLVGLWHGVGSNVIVWALYSGLWLGLEAVGLGPRIARLPAPVRHLYVLLVVVVGWVILRANTLAAATTFLGAMAGWSGPATMTAHRYLTTPVWTALGLALLGAGPLVPAISRWRVSLDVAAASLLMMSSATVVFIGMLLLKGWLAVAGPLKLTWRAGKKALQSGKSRRAV